MLLLVSSLDSLDLLEVGDRNGGACCFCEGGGPGSGSLEFATDWKHLLSSLVDETAASFETDDSSGSHDDCCTIIGGEITVCSGGSEYAEGLLTCN